MKVLLDISSSKQATNWMMRNKPNTKIPSRAVRKEELCQSFGIAVHFLDHARPCLSPGFSVISVYFCVGKSKC